ncbi:MAG TPA: alpha/beta fold hydrolase [Solirubrobacterales bacterium]|jgi:pimeloyl-ACP methyl ester carboxylesterase|nr:alpha/beta fold hydrolase [Solirubrobacterales bacterium]HMU26859.1 alpha/beta fold hydrolase [Solirubrobacterales bacterium]HMX70527.1 alpha/beta fold hydrolase [Solirubrobacterales bacterium]HMY26215.1 alpha/beta fold hydrolase [Solirubrobacterales bacterium]HNA23185.1 alpha/beta fold hydrolase [Solirubrobacterales bacterium]
MTVRQTIEIHGQPVTYHKMGEGPPVLLVHGITSSSRTWKSVMPRLAETHTVIAPDLLGHGRSAKPQGDYSLGAYASGMRDLLVALDVEKVNVVGHSLGGGVAMQFAYQFPDRISRLVLVDTGGIGREVNPALRAAALPGAEFVLPLLFTPTLHDAGLKVRNFFAGFGIHGNADVEGVAEGFASLTEADARRAFINTVRSVIDPTGQRVSAADRLYLTAEIPSLIVWGDRDRIIPVAHADLAHELMPGSRLEIFPGAGHFPFNDDPDRFIRIFEEFIATTEEANLDQDHIRRMLLRRQEEDRAAAA